MTALSSSIKRRGIPEPLPDVDSLFATVSALQEIVEELTRQRGTELVSAATVQDLVDLGLVENREGGRVILPPVRSA